VVFTTALEKVVVSGFVIGVGVFIAIVNTAGILISIVGIIVVGVAMASPRTTMAINGGMHTSDREVSTLVSGSEVLFLVQLFSKTMGNHGFLYSDINDMQNFWGFFVLSALARAC
jgi:hypothetical protein